MLWCSSESPKSWKQELGRLLSPSGLQLGPCCFALPAVRGHIKPLIHDFPLSKILNRATCNYFYLHCHLDFFSYFPFTRSFSFFFFIFWVPFLHFSYFFDYIDSETFAMSWKWKMIWRAKHEIHIIFVCKLNDYNITMLKL